MACCDLSMIQPPLKSIVLKLEKYVEGVLEGMSKEDLDCNFRMNGEDVFDFKVTDKS